MDRGEKNEFRDLPPYSLCAIPLITIPQRHKNAGMGWCLLLVCHDLERRIASAVENLIHLVRPTATQGTVN